MKVNKRGFRTKSMFEQFLLMDLDLLVTLSLCCWTAAARSLWSNKPAIFGSDEVEDGESVKVSCTVPIDYRGGACRLFRGHAHDPFKVMTAVDYVCVFQLTSQELLGEQPAGSRVFLRCDYQLQGFTSETSYTKGVTVWGSSPSPGLSVSRRFVSPDDSVEVTCSPPLRSVSSCHFYRDQVRVAEGSCSRNLTGKQLAIWEKPTLLLPVNLTCRYRPDHRRHIRSEPSDHSLLFVVDASQVVSSADCEVSVQDDQLLAFRDDSWTSVGAEGLTLKVQATNRRLMINETCNHVQSLT